LLVDYRDLYTAEQWKRHEVKPGIAGPVAAFGRNLLSWEEKFVLDSWYVDHWSLALDLRILILTFLKALSRKGVNAAGYATMPRFEGTPPAGGEGNAQAPRGDGLLEKGVMRQVPKKI
jgi:hypothetical protein